MARSTTGRTTSTVAGAVSAALLLASCGLTGPNSSSSNKATGTTVKKPSSTAFPTVPYVSTTSTTTTTLASVNPGGAGGQPVNTDSPTSYTVKAGDVAVLIARKYQITLAELAAANPDKALDRIVPGDTLVIPAPTPGGGVTPPIPPPSGTTRAPSATTGAAKTGATYTVQPGDTLLGIAKKIGIAVATLQQLNPGVTPEGLQVGQKLNIPTGSGAAAPTTTIKK